VYLFGRQLQKLSKYYPDERRRGARNRSMVPIALKMRKSEM
jgi:hypothetical protein